MTLLFIDTETTGTTQRHLPPDDPRQPLPVQLGAILTTDGHCVMYVLGAIISRRWAHQREPIHIPDDAAAVHGITDDVPDEWGRPVEVVLSELRWMIDRATRVVAHNAEFDVAVVQRAYRAQSLPVPPLPDVYCTMVESTAVCAIPHPSRLGLKRPRLGEAYARLVGREMPSGAHDALADAYACRAIYRRLVTKSD